MKWLPPRVAVPASLACLALAGYLYYLASTRKGKKKAGPLAAGILLTLIGLLLPVLSFGVIKKLKRRRAPKPAGNGLTVPGAALFS